MKLFFSLLLITLIFSCKTTGVFEEDFNELGLPRYTEKGNNAAGIYIDDEIWITEYFKRNNLNFGDEYQDPLRYFLFQDSLYLGLSGRKQNSADIYMFIFNIGNYEEFNTEKLVNLKNENFDLNDNNTKLLLGDTTSSVFNDTIGSVVRGNLIIRETIYEDPEEGIDYILAGTFGFDATFNGDTINFHQGRFDFSEIQKEELNTDNNLLRR
ncbi:hypothetical protein ABWH96_18720 [Marivirga tractuosa]|uniref:hypothetical protein n=1 Tax=Marivirga tractuosa TaxID=1006 RepID=UPI0035CF4962